MSQDILNLEEDLKELQYFAETDNKAALMVKITEMQKENNKKVEEFYDWSNVQSAIDETVRLKEVCNDFNNWADGIITDMKNRHGG
tara:strand:- start:14 stop:271 length:258 start_codon:yes stop_codon:yes gene_type:complete